MSTVARTPGALLEALIDDAAVFPPGNAPIPAALAAHRRHRTAPHAQLVGRFLCPASRLDELGGQLDAQPDPAERLRVGLVVDTGVAGLADALARIAAEARLVLAAVEIPLRPGVDAPGALAACARTTVAALPDRTAYLEIPRTPGWKDALDVVTAYGRGAKLRTGGPVAEAVPSVAELAEFVTACAERGTPFKCTAGLHHAVRHRDPGTGGWQHGFLNVVLAAHAARTGGDVAAVLAETDPAALVALAGGIGETAARATRHLYVGFGSCSIAEPVADLTELGLL